MCGNRSWHTYDMHSVLPIKLGVFKERESRIGRIERGEKESRIEHIERERESYRTYREGE
jgi:hypothetical protein